MTAMTTPKPHPFMRWLLAALLFCPQDTVAELIRKLGSQSLEERDTAAAELVRRGPAALPDVEAALKSSDAEVAGRAKAVHEAILRRPDLLVRKLDALWKAHANAQDAFVREAESAVQASLIGQLLPDVDGALHKQKFEVMEHWRYGAADRRVRYTLARPPYEFVVEVYVRLQPSRTAPTKALVRSAHAGLLARPRATLADVRKAPPYTKGSVFAAALEDISPEHGATEDAELESIQLWYRPTPRPTFELNEPAASVHDVVIRVGTKFGIAHVSALWADQTLRIQSVSDARSGDWVLRRSPHKPPRDADDMPIACSPADLKLLPATTTRVELVGDLFKPDDLKELARLLDLRELCIGLATLPSGAIDGMEGLPIESLAVSPEAQLGLAPRLPKLRRLRVSGVLGEADLRLIAGLKDLAELSLDGYLTTGQALTPIFSMKALRALHLGTLSSLPSSILSRIATLENLREVSVSLVELKSADLRTLRKLTSLESLDLTGAQLDKDAVAELAALKTLRRITLQGSRVLEDADLKPLAALEKVEVFTVRRCDRVTRTGMKALQATLKEKWELETAMR